MFLAIWNIGTVRKIINNKVNCVKKNDKLYCYLIDF